MMNIDVILPALEKFGGWGLFALVVVIILINIIRNPSFIEQVLKLIDHFTKPKKEAEYGNFKLFKLKRTQPKTWTLVATIIATILNVFFLVVFGSLIYIVIVSKSPQAINPIMQLFLALLFLFPFVSLIDTYAHISSSLNMELDGDSGNLLRFCQKRFFDIGARITQFDAEAGEIGVKICGNEITIKIEGLENSHNKFTLCSKGRFISTILYSAEYRKHIDNLVRDLCYNPQTKI